MPWSSTLSRVSLPSRATNLAITCTLAIGIHVLHFAGNRGGVCATSELDRSTSDLLPGQSAFASLLDRPSPSLPASAMRTQQERGQRALFRPDHPPPCVYGLRAFLDRARYHRSSHSIRADRRWESSCTFCAEGRTIPALLRPVLRSR